jgi:hypothetical protein
MIGLRGRIKDKRRRAQREQHGETDGDEVHGIDAFEPVHAARSTVPTDQSHSCLTHLSPST